MPKPSELFPKILEAAMEARGMNQTRLAKTSGVSQSNISLYLKGTGAPTIDSLAGLATGLGVSTDSLLGIEPVPIPPGPRDPTPLEIAIYLFEGRADGVEENAMTIIKRALEADRAQLAVLARTVEAMFAKSSVEDLESSS